MQEKVWVAETVNKTSLIIHWRISQMGLIDLIFLRKYILNKYKKKTRRPPPLLLKTYFLFFLFSHADTHWQRIIHNESLQSSSPHMTFIKRANFSGRCSLPLKQLQQSFTPEPGSPFLTLLSPLRWGLCLGKSPAAFIFQQHPDP